MGLTVSEVRKVFIYTPKGNIEKYLPFINLSLGKYQITEPLLVRYILCTVYAECQPFKPLIEKPHKFNTKVEPFDLYIGKGGNLNQKMAEAYLGRGFIQLTTFNNYRDYSKKLGIDLIADPDLAADPKIAADILVLFIKERMGKILPALKAGEFIKARKQVNGGKMGIQHFMDAWQRSEFLS